MRDEGSPETAEGPTLADTRRAESETAGPACAEYERGPRRQTARRAPISSNAMGTASTNMAEGPACANSAERNGSGKDLK